ncbi:MAG: choice-of-anchor V domain-containing protein, partial [Balneolaceae bacterium]
MIRFFTQLSIAILIPVLTGLTLPENKSVPVASHDYPDQLPGAFTGGFGEETCNTCHFDYDINPEGGSLTVEGLEENYQPGERYEITVTVESERLERGGFQMTARFGDGTQAGQFEWEGNRLGLTSATADEIQYIQHTPVGTNPTSEKEVRWSFIWEAPDKPSEPVTFNITANAGN